MAKNTPKKNAFYTGAETFETPDTHPRTDAHEYTHTDTDAHADVVQVETKSKRAYLLVRPSVWERLTKHAKASHRSNNDIVNELIEQYLEDNNA